jgi:hypothetical protein
MIIGKLTRYYFIFWALYLPLAVILTIITKSGLFGFSSITGIGALGLLVFLSIELLVMKPKKELPKLTNRSVTPVPVNDNLEGFRNIIAEVQQ